MHEDRLLRLLARLRIARWVLIALSLLCISVIFGCEAFAWNWDTPYALDRLLALAILGSFLAFLVCDLVIRILGNYLKGRTLAQHLAWCVVYLLLYVGYAVLWFLYWLVNFCIIAYFGGVPTGIQ